ncbi:MAG: hypothetical protein ACRCZM_10395 [Bacteroidales bacterium]
MKKVIFAMFLAGTFMVGTTAVAQEKKQEPTKKECCSKKEGEKKGCCSDKKAAGEKGCSSKAGGENKGCCSSKKEVKK